MREFEKAGVAATDARLDPDLTIMARTDALTVEGIDRAIERMQRYLEAGAGMAFIEAPESEEQMRRITREIPAPSMANMVPGGRTPLLDAARLQELGFACVAHPTALSYTLARAARELLDELNAKGTTSGFEDRSGREPRADGRVGFAGGAERRRLRGHLHLRHCHGPAGGSAPTGGDTNRV